VPWCPQVSTAINHILYWKGLRKPINRHNIGSSVIKQWAKKGSIASHANNYQLQDKIIQENIKKAYKAFHQLKSDPDRQDTWLAGIIRAQAMAKGTTTKTLWKQHRAAEKARNTARLVQLILKSTQRQGSLQVVIGPTPDGQQSEFSTKHSLEKACLEEAGRRFTQAKDTPLLQEHLLKRFGELSTN